MFLGGVANGERYSNELKENEMWEKANPRILFVTKDQNTGGGDAWDVRVEIGKLSYTFYRNLTYQLYGLLNTSKEHQAAYDDISNEEVLQIFLESPVARINVKKLAGGNSITNAVLREYLNRDRAFIIEQIDNLDADIILCCGYSESIEDTGNLILNFLNNNGYNFVREDGNYWVYYDRDKKKIAINNWHLSARVSSRETFEEMIAAYHRFLQDHSDFPKR